jgi:hypothetical protein
MQFCRHGPTMCCNIGLENIGGSAVDLGFIIVGPLLIENIVEFSIGIMSNTSTGTAELSTL